jgi:hypothetical protein
MVGAVYQRDNKFDSACSGSASGWISDKGVVPAVRMLILMLAGTLVLGGCEAIRGNSGERAAEAQLRATEVDTRLAELESVSAADRARIAMLEGENSDYEDEAEEMRAEILRLQTTAARLRRLETQIQATAAAAVGEAPADATPTTTGAVMANPEDGGFAAHLASYRVRERAVEGWQEYVERYPEVIGELDGILAVFDVPSLGGRFFRLKAGPFTSEVAAQDFCDQLEALNEYCVVDVYDGEIIR